MMDFPLLLWSYQFTLQDYYYLHLNVENADLALLRNILHCLHSSAVVIAAKLRVLDKGVLAHEIQEIFFSGEVILASIFFPRTGSSSGI
jgi:hypothetical protein